MARRLFKQHLSEAALSPIGQIDGVVSADEGLLSCVYVYPEGVASGQVAIQLCSTNLDQYPDGNSFMLFTDDETVDPVVPETLQRVADSATGKTLTAILPELSRQLTAALTGGNGDKTDIEGVADSSDDFDTDLDVYEAEDDAFGLSELCRNNMVEETHGGGASSKPESVSRLGASVDIMRKDLRVLKEAGFRVGFIGSLIPTPVLCVSIRVVKLGLSEEAMQAWGLRRKHYLILLIKYWGGYVSIKKLAEDPQVHSSVKMRVGLCEHYKPCLSDDSLFLDSADQAPASYKYQVAGEGHGLEPLFIGKALNQHLEERLFLILKARISHGFSWLGAETFVGDRHALAASAPIDLRKYQDNDDDSNRNLPAIVLADHMREVPLEATSLPLIIMQFVLRHFVRCTEFCMVCHSRLEDSFEALKPYVCTKPLCLYQYMSLGFGTSLEWEICSQPYVVDLLISFCYTAASLGRLKVLPIGMGLVVPALPPAPGSPLDPATNPQIPLPQPNTSPQGGSFSCRWFPGLNLLRIDEEHQSENVSRLKRGDWLVVKSEKTVSPVHYRVQDVALPNISLGVPISADNADLPATAKSKDGRVSLVPNSVDAQCYVYVNQFKDLSATDQQVAITTLLDALPGVGEMYKYLETRTRSHPGQACLLKSWSDRIPESSINLLRWIVASNRSCIAQVDKISNNDIKCKTSPVKENRIGGMDGWMQFRFAQGAPDKEKRFSDCVTAQAAATGTKHPTLFAWHGSRLANWHSIVRVGLNYDEMAHGRAYGNGVYLSPWVTVSLPYSGGDHASPQCHWRRSMLNVSRAISLNEVVNNPDKFVSTEPHFVITKLDWIQTRYLFIKAATDFKAEPRPLTEVYQQDPKYPARNEGNYAITIPLSAISKSRRPYESIQVKSTGNGKRAKTVVGVDQATAERQEDDANSVLSDDSDLAILEAGKLKDGEDDQPSLERDGSLLEASKEESAAQGPATDFVPGTLDVSNIKFLDPPKDATSTSTKALMRLLREALDLQEKTAPAQLGWYIDRNLISNMYQWIVELHSFPATLPLAQDMKSVGITSIVLEMRFSSQFPFSPPFIRVVKPRFLPFAAGGGGNVTEGGAMCMEVLTNNGWSAAQNIESLLLLVRMAILDEERPARLAMSNNQSQTSYNIVEAVNAYVRACHNHGWQIPAGFDKLHLE